MVGMTAPRNISLARLFACVTVFAAGLGSWRAAEWANHLPGYQPNTLTYVFWFLHLSLPCIAVGALVKRPWIGLTIGVGLFVASVALMASQAARE